MTNSIAEFRCAKSFFCIGTNMTEAHPVIATFVINAVERGADLIVVDPRKQKLADYASIFAQIKVGSDIAFLNGLMNVLIAEGLYDKEFVANFCDNFDEVKVVTRNYTPERAAEICGVPAQVIREIARRLAKVKPTMLCYTLGITEHTCGVHNVFSVANLQMMLGNMGVECGGVNPLRGQNNVQGACDMGALPNVYHGYHPVASPESKYKFEKAWGTALSDKPGLMMPQMFEGMSSGKIRFFWCFGEDPAKTEPDLNKLQRELSSVEFMVSQEIFMTETAKFAHVILPAAAWGEADGTYTNSERRINRVRKVSEAPGMARPNWWIFREVARRMGHNWDSGSAQEIWDKEISELAPAMRGIKYYRLEGDGLQWPCIDEDHCGTPVLHKGGRFAAGLGLFKPVDWTPPAEMPNGEYPFILSTGRRLYQYNAGNQSSRGGMDVLLPEETVDLSSVDADELGIVEGERVKVSSRRGSVTVRARIVHEVPKGMVWMSFHHQPGNANWLTNSVYDPLTLTAEYKACAVRVEKIKDMAGGE